MILDKYDAYPGKQEFDGSRSGFWKHNIKWAPGLDQL